MRTRYIVASFLSFLLAQVSKLGLTFLQEKRLEAHRLVSSGGMPSSHSALVMGLTTSVGLGHGADSAIFAISLIFSVVVMYDAAGVRLQAGQHADVLNQIVFELPPEHPVANSFKPLREMIGHTPVQVVAGALLGMLVASVVHVIVSI